MAESKPKNAPAPEKQVPSNVVALAGPHQCVAEGCKHKPERAQFCAEHYMWFKEGLVTMQGARAKDFDKKFYAFQQRSKKAS